MSEAGFKVEKGVPMPAQSGRERYPFGEMEVGDSFEFDTSHAPRIGNAAVNYGKHNGKRFAVRSLGNGRSRCWRVE